LQEFVSYHGAVAHDSLHFPLKSTLCFWRFLHRHSSSYHCSRNMEG